VGLVLGQLGIVTALAFYFGRARASAYLEYFGLDLTVVDFSPQDYVLRSIGAVYWPLMGGGLLLVVGLAAHPRIRAALSSRGVVVRRRFLAAATLAGLVLLGVAAAGLRQMVIFPSSVPVIPLLLAAGIGLLTYGWLLRGWTSARGAGSQVSQGQLVGLMSFLVGALFWALASYAAAVGVADAKSFDESLPYRPAVVVFSERRLALAGPGLTVDQVGGQDSKYRFRYVGLRQLLRGGNRYFLIPTDWQRGEDAVIQLSESDEVRIEFIGPPYP